MKSAFFDFSKRPILLKLAAGILFLVLFFLVHLCFQDDNIYNATLGHLTLQYENNEGTIGVVDKPYEEIANEKLVHWDAVHYNAIRNNIYDQKEIGGVYNFAFFPLFPLVWKIFSLSPLGICIMNFIFFIVAVIIISYYVSENSGSRPAFLTFIAAISLPTSVVFFIPYAEALFILMFAIAIIGFFKGKYWLFFLGLFLFAMVRSAVVIIALSLFAVEIIYFFRHKSIPTFLKRFLTPVIPLVAGTLAVCILQLYYGSGSLLKFMEVHKYWGHTLQVPRMLIDWSLEGFGLNLASLFMITIPCLIFIIIFFISQTKKKDQHAGLLFSKNATNEERKEYLFLLSCIYVIGVSLFILLYQGGNLAGSFRYIICSPFFYIIFFYTADKVKKASPFTLITCFLVAFGLGLIVFTYAPYSGKPGFADTGFFLLGLSIAWLIFKNNMPLKLRTSVLIVLILCNIIWNTYLFNCYLNNGWIII